MKLAHSWTWVILILAQAVAVQGSRDCGKKATDPCPGDPRYGTGGNNLAQQADIWRRSGFYAVNIHQFEETYAPDIETPVRRWQRSPILGFVNITVHNTRYYYHSYLILQNLILRNESTAAYWEMYGHSNYEKDGRALLLDERSQDPFDFPSGYRTPAQQAFIQPAGNDTSIRYVTGGIPDPFLDPSSSNKLAFFETEKVTCQDPACNTMVFVEEYFTQLGERMAFSSGTYTKMKEAEWMDSIKKAYDDYQIPASLRKPVPMQTCLVDAYCVSESEWCTSGDPSCSESPYQEDTNLLPGVIAGIVLLSVSIAVIAAAAFWIYAKTTKESRYRTEYISRFSEDVSLQKPMKEISPENMSREFKFIDKDGKGYMTKGEFADFMLSTKRDKTITDADLSALWLKMDLDGNGTVDYVEFCAFTADCYNEHSSLREKLRMETKKTAAEAA